VHQGWLRHSAVKRTAKEGEPNGRNDGGGTEPVGLSERPQEAGGDKSAGGPPAREFMMGSPDTDKDLKAKGRGTG
jgi:hypothetical protein